MTGVRVIDPRPLALRSNTLLLSHAPHMHSDVGIESVGVCVTVDTLYIVNMAIPLLVTFNDMQEVVRISCLKIGNGQAPFGAKRVEIQTGPEKTGPFATAWTFDVRNVDYTLEEYSFPGPRGPTGRWIRLLFVSNYGSTQYVKMMEIEFFGVRA